MSECGCWHNHMTDEINYCPMHKAAPELVKALEEIEILGRDIRSTLATSMGNIARQALAQVEDN